VKSKVEAFYDRDAPIYDARYDGDPFFVKVYLPLTWDHIRRYLPPTGGRILDAGGGTGRWTLRLAGLGYQVTLTDISQGMLDVARQKLEAAGLLERVTIERMDICDMGSLADASFDLVMAMGDPLSYCGDQEAAVAEMARVAKPGAAVLASVDSRMQAVRYLRELDFKGAEALLETGEAEWPEEDPDLRFPIHAFTVAELTALFERHALRVVRVMGKPVFFPRLPEKVQQLILADEDALQRLLALEIAYGTEPGWAGMGGHLQVAGIKRLVRGHPSQR